MKYPKLSIFIFTAVLFVAWSCNRTRDSYTLNKHYMVENNRVYFTDINTSNPEKFLLKKANPTNFKILTHSKNRGRKDGSCYACDKLLVYYKNKIIAGANPATFSILTDGYSKDQKSVFFMTRFLKNANPKYFKTLGNYYAKDNQRIWFCDKELASSVNPENFEIIDGYFSKDSTLLFLNNENKLIPIKGIDPLHFTKCNSKKNVTDSKFLIYHSKDNVIILDRSKNTNQKGFIQKITADIKSFEIINEFYFKDSLSVFYKAVKINSANPDSFMVPENKYAKDSSNIYDKSKKNIGANPKKFRLARNDTCDTANPANYFHKGNTKKSLSEPVN
ncbi:MAG: DKNYY domain-containing protein [Bacteroidota bacterium]|nr:DKNYY domain-containing protein [Bacteroidota bacterium]